MNTHLDDGEGRELSEFVDALLKERMRRARGGSQDDTCSSCGHQALWHAPECQMCSGEQTSRCPRFQS